MLTVVLILLFMGAILILSFHCLPDRLTNNDRLTTTQAMVKTWVPNKHGVMFQPVFLFHCLSERLANNDILKTSGKLRMGA